ncbi:MAG: M17 family peptidase N-terminal domain-containing protein, partial [Pseudomonadota bacterium]
MNITFSKGAAPKTGALVAPVTQGQDIAKALAGLGRAAITQAKHAASADGFTGKPGQALEVLAPSGLKNSRLLLFGLGKASGLDGEKIERFGARAVVRLLRTRDAAAAFLLEGVSTDEISNAEAAARAAFGARLRAYRFDRYRSTLKPDQNPSLNKITVRCDNANAGRDAFADIAARAEG